MADALPEMKRSLFFCFKVGKGKFRIFQVLAWKSRKSNDITFEESSGKYTCDCTKFKFDSKCIHLKILKQQVKKFGYAHEDFRATDAIAWTDDLAADKGCVIMYDQTDDVLCCVHKSVGNLSLFNLLWLMSTGPTDGITATGGELNPNRIYTECEASERLGVSVDDTGVRKAGDDADPSEAMDLPEAEPAEEFDEELTFDSSESVSPDKLLWKATKRPRPEEFFVHKDDWEQLMVAFQEGVNILLIGPSGCGKSELCYIASQAVSRELVAFNMGAMSDPRISLIGSTHFDREKGTWFQESRFVSAVQSKNGVVLLDELTRATRGAFNILLPLLDRQGYLALDESEDAAVIHKAEGMTFLSTANQGAEYTGTDPIDKALKDRHGIVLDLFFPPESSEIAVLKGRCKGLPADDAKKLVDLATQQRNLTRNDGEFQEYISTRMLLQAGSQIAMGVPYRAACKFCIENHFSADGGDASDRTKIRQIVQKAG